MRFVLLTAAFALVAHLALGAWAGALVVFGAAWTRAHRADVPVGLRRAAGQGALALALAWAALWAWTWTAAPDASARLAATVGGLMGVGSGIAVVAASVAVAAVVGALAAGVGASASHARSGAVPAA